MQKNRAGMQVPTKFTFCGNEIDIRIKLIENMWHKNSTSSFQTILYPDHEQNV